jgi:hypothetical protein
MKGFALIFFAVKNPNGLTVRPVQPAPFGFATSKNRCGIPSHFD